MALSFGKRDVQKIADVLEEEYDDAIEAAEAVLNAAYELIKGKAKFTVVGQLRQIGSEKLGVRDERAVKVALGWYGTEKQATADALRLAYSQQTHEQHHAHVLPIFNGTPFAYYGSRKKGKEASAMLDASWRENELARRDKWLEEHSGEQPPEEWGVFAPFKHETDECSACKGMGRVRRAVSE